MTTIDPQDTLPADSPALDALARGRELRARVPRRAHAGFEAREPEAAVQRVLSSNEGRLEDLVPVRMGRMSASPFAFLRGSAAAMAADIATMPATDIRVQLCGDAHLANFGVFASPERQLVFDLNDFDETHPGPWEWDVKRLAASFVVASRGNGYAEATCREMAWTAANAYRSSIRRYAGMRALDVWYAHIPITAVIQRVEDARRKTGLRISLADAQRRDHIAALGKLSEKAPGGGWLFRDQPPLLVRLRPDDVRRTVVPHMRELYVRSLPADRRVLVEKYRLLDVALKVVGVGSVGTRCYVALFAGPAGGPLVLQVKEARESVLAPYVKTRFRRHQGARVVIGQRIMQAFSDIFLGWTHSPLFATDFYVRQLYDMKYAFDIEDLLPVGMKLTAEVCGWALARAHARSGNPATIAGYLGKGTAFEDAIAEFGARYADQTERDHAAFVKAIKAGRIPAVAGI
jgi:uncharacterized protein (DUF2252 family)